MLTLYITNLIIQFIITQQSIDFSTNTTIKKQAIRIENYNIIASSLKEARKIINNNNSNCAS